VRTRLSTLCFVALTVLSACAPPVQPVVAPPLLSQEALAARQQKTAAQEKKQDEAGQEFHARWNRWTAQAKQFRSELEAVNQEATLLTYHPGWSDMAQILKSSAAIRHLEGEYLGQRKLTAALTQWSQKWQANGEAIYEKSRVLFNRITVADTTFRVLEKDYEEVAGLLVIFMITMVEARPNSYSLSNQASMNDFLMKTADAVFYAPAKAIRSELLALLQRPPRILGLIDKEQP
jgi:hypothetical protein